MPQITIERAAANEIKLIAVLGAATFYQAYYLQDESRNLANYIADSFSVQQIAAELADENSTFFVVYRSDKAVGYAKLRENSKAECVADENAIELQRLYVLPEVFGAGAGAQLLHRCLAEAQLKKYESLWLSVWAENKRARRFYEKHGFEPIGTSVFVYNDETGDNIVMRKFVN